MKIANFSGTTTNQFLPLVLTSVLMLSLVPALALAKNLHRASGKLVSHTGSKFSPSSLKGKKVISTVVYTSCPTICLFTIENIKKIEAFLENSQDYTFLLVTADPKGDTPQVMTEYLKKHNVDKPNWIFVGGERKDVAKLAAHLDMGFAKKTGANHIMHSIKIAYVDETGELVHKIQGVEPPTDELVQAVKRHIALQTSDSKKTD